MKQSWIMMIVLALCLSFLVWADEDEDTPKAELETFVEKSSYVLGMKTGTSLKQIPTKIDLPAFFRGVEDIFKGNELVLTPEQAEEIKKEFAQKIKDEQIREQNELVEKNKKEGEMFLEENKKKEGVITTDSGLQYKVLTEGSGPKPKATDTVSVHYRGTLIDGTEFDSSYKRGKPASFPVNRVIAGWTEALQLMSMGSKYRLFIPSNLAYGERGTGKLIGPNATLIFDVELLEIKK